MGSNRVSSVEPVNGIFILKEHLLFPFRSMNKCSAPKQSLKALDISTPGNMQDSQQLRWGTHVPRGSRTSQVTSVLSCCLFPLPALIQKKMNVSSLSKMGVLL